MASIQPRGKTSFLLVVEAGKDSKGKRRKKTKTIRVDEKLLKTPKKLREHLDLELAKFRIEVEAGTYIAPEKMTFESFITEWEEKYARTKDGLAPLTLKTYKHHLSNHILPVFGHKRLEEIKPIHIVTFLSDLRKPGARKDGRGEVLSSGTIEYIYRVLRNVFNRAADWRVIPIHPMEGIKKPTVETEEREFYTQAEAQEVLLALREVSPMWRLFIYTAILGGLRRGEILALEWTDVDFDNATISVNKSISLTINGQAVIKEPKTKKSKRTVEMPSWYIEELKTYKKHWNQEKLLRGEDWEGRDYQFIFHAGYGKPLYHTQPYKWWTEFCVKHNFKRVSFHELRHSHFAILLENGVDLKTIQERAGHASFKTTTDIYGHVADTLKRDAANKLEILDPKKTSTTRQQA